MKDLKNSTCPHDYENPIRKGRARYVCRLCGADISLRIVLLQDAQSDKITLDEILTWAEGIMGDLGTEYANRVTNDEALIALAITKVREINNVIIRLVLAEQGWRSMETAPRDGTQILGWCVHEADDYFIDEGHRLTPYGANAEGLSHVDDGMHIIEWHGEIDEEEYTVPAWWCLSDGYGETAANPTHWMPLPIPPNKGIDVTIRLVTPDGLGSQYVKPERVEIEDDGSYTLVVKAWRDKNYDVNRG